MEFPDQVPAEKSGPFVFEFDFLSCIAWGGHNHNDSVQDDGPFIREFMKVFDVARTFCVKDSSAASESSMEERPNSEEFHFCHGALAMQTSSSIPRAVLSRELSTGRWQGIGPSGGSIGKHCLALGVSHGGETF